MRSPAARAHDIRLSAFREDALAPCYGRIKISKTELHKVGLCATRNTVIGPQDSLKHWQPSPLARTGRGGKNRQGGTPSTHDTTHPTPQATESPGRSLD